MNEFVKTLNLNVKTSVDASSFNKVKQSFDELRKSNESIKVGFDFNESQLKEIKKSITSEFSSTAMSKLNFFDSEEERQNAEQIFNDYQETLAKIELLKKAIEETQMFDKDSKHLKEMTEELEKLKKHKNDIDHENDEDEGSNVAMSQTFRDGWQEAKESWANQHNLASLGGKAFQKMTNSIEEFKNKALATFKQFVSDALEELEEMASWDIHGSTKYNKAASDMYMNYGLQGADAYAMNAALKATGIDDMETYLTDPMVRGNQALLDAFNEQYDIAKQQYEEDMEVAKAYQEFQKEFDVFKKELQKSLIDFFMTNKDTIMSILTFLMQSMEWLVKLVGDIVSFFGGGTQERTNEQRQAAMNELLGVTNNSSITNNKSTNVNVSNTYNGVGKTDQSFLQNSGQLTYQQIIEYLGRD